MTNSKPIPYPFEPANGRFREALARAILKHPVLNSKHVYAFETVASTMDVAHAYASAQSRDAYDASCVQSGLESDREAIFFAITQTKGRGRYDRVWVSDAMQGIFVSYAFLFSKPSPEISSFSLAAGLAVHRTLQSFGASPYLKWPNDVLLREQSTGRFRKVCGILSEAQSAPGGEQWVILGLGLNVSQNEFPDGIPGISLLQSLGKKIDYYTLAASLSAELMRIRAEFERDGFGPLSDEWWNASIPDAVQVKTAEHPSGVKAVGVAPDGALLVTDEQGNISRIYSGEIEIGEIEIVSV